MRRWMAVCGLAVAVMLALPGQRAEAQTAPGDLVVIDYHVGPEHRGALFIVKPDGTRTLFSDFGNPAQGPLGRDPYGIARHPSGDFYVIDQTAGADCNGTPIGCGALFKVDRVTGGRMLISDFGNLAQGPTGSGPFGVAIGGGGQILVADPSGASGSRLYQVDAATGMRTVLSDFTDAQKGWVGRAWGVGLAGGEIFVTEITPVAVSSKLLRVDGAGTRSVVTDFLNPAQGPLGLVPIAVAPDIVPNHVLVVEQLEPVGHDGFGSLFSVNTSTGSRTVITDFTTTNQGPLGFNPSGAAVTAQGDILVIDFDAGTNSLGGLFVVDRTTGQRCLLSDFGNPAQGPLGDEPSGFVIVPGGPGLGSGLVAAVLPSSRSVQVNSTATAFVTIVNTGCATARNVGITLTTAIPANFSYQTTDPVTNVPTGQPDTPVDIPIGGSQTFVIAITPTAAFPPTEVTFRYDGSNAPPVAVLIGVNTLLLSASDTPVPDIVALMATLSNDGIINIPGATGTGVCSVATVNVGAGASITVSANTGAAILPVTPLVCQTNPVTGVCFDPPALSVTVQIDAGATPTFAAFVIGGGIVPFDPALYRLFIVFTDAGNIVRGATSGALRTQ